MNKDRIDKTHDALSRSDLDALVLIPGASQVYVSGLHFHLMERPVVLILKRGGSQAIVLPELEIQKLSDLPYEIAQYPYGENPEDWNKVFQNVISALKLDGKKIGMEPLSLRMLEYGFIQAAAPNATFQDAQDLISSLRLTKEEGEIEALREAVNIAQNALESTLPFIKIGMTEKQVAGELSSQLFRSGSEPEFPFSPIVSAGLNGANPHAVPTNRKLTEGDLLVIDWGARADGYISDLTRTFAIGEIDPEMIKIHQIVQEANAAGRAAGEPGKPCAAVDIAARDVIEKSGYGKFFTHRTGHGIGMESHEEPYMRGDNMKLLLPGMTYTVEPGIYLPGINGVRIEDNMLVTQTGSESLSSMERKIRVIG
ncbi:MAG: M24 family metallopeptidase [Anaerolineales bacterium]